jgi:hypothetical protein
MIRRHTKLFVINNHLSSLHIQYSMVPFCRCPTLFCRKMYSSYTNIVGRGRADGCIFRICFRSGLNNCRPISLAIFIYTNPSPIPILYTLIRSLLIIFSFPQSRSKEHWNRRYSVNFTFGSSVVVVMHKAYFYEFTMLVHN